MLIKAIIGLNFLCQLAMASEIDSFSHRFDRVLEDSSAKINSVANNLIEEVIDKTNRNSNNCNEIYLYQNLRKEFHNHFFGHFNKFISFSNEIDRIQTTTDKSIYSDFDAKDSIVLGIYSKYVTNPLGSIINISGNYVGTDKFEHFAGTGYVYFMSHYINQKTIGATMNIGNNDENGILGALSTGVISYGDMSAEFNGMRFWNHILAKQPDILGNNLGPYIKCESNKWIKTKNVDLAQYVDSSWDEALNCSMFRTQKMVDKVKKSLEKLEDVTGSSYTCPLDKQKILAIKAKYGEYSKNIINTEGLKVKSH